MVAHGKDQNDQGTLLRYSEGDSDRVHDTENLKAKEVKDQDTAVAFAKERLKAQNIGQTWLLTRYKNSVCCLPSAFL